MKLNIRTSYDSFRALRESNSYYIDKSEIIEEYLIEKFEKAVMFARPRRFGKTLTMTMIRDFLDIRQDSTDIFDGLKIMNSKDAVENYMNKYPVIFISFKEMYGESFNSVFRNLQNQMSARSLHIFWKVKIQTMPIKSCLMRSDTVKEILKIL